MRWPRTKRAERASVEMGSLLHTAHDMGTRAATYELQVRRLCLVCEYVEYVWEPPETDEIGTPCSRCRAPTERVAIVERRRVRRGQNSHAAALGRLGGLKGGPARASKLSARRRRAIARAAARVRWNRPDSDEKR